ncbi:TetR/AcrR family transcriptional regulator [Bacillus sp. Marseille-P3800]|uniref:TetR/AcrR family transcriptional regulator n=1 Tax=Bacillus sp. Marseille-P3800 TaxID=2014782 RepID=UPI00159BA692|nr:TetR/AcrR family transcriptional regulator C-terminal domain-containing protein [Bacillus sp. Marseille-P3800]
MTKDRRIMRTRNDLKLAFLSLLKKKKDIKKVSIIDIVEQANYNRATFYVHYSDKYALAEDIINDTIEGFIQSFRDPYKQTNAHQIDLNTLSHQAIKIFGFIEEHCDQFKLLFENVIFLDFRERFFDRLKEVFKKDLLFMDEKKTRIDEEIYAQIQVQQMMGYIKFWVENNFTYSAEFMAEQVLLISQKKSTIIGVVSNEW